MTARPTVTAAEDPAGAQPAEPTTGARRPAWLRLLSPPMWLPPLVAQLVVWSTFLLRTNVGPQNAFRPAMWGRWDSGWYMRIAKRGYEQWQCTPHGVPPHAPPGHYLCGSIGWFPGYPTAVRAAAAVTGWSVPAAGLLVAWVAWYVALFLMWHLLADARSATTRWACLLLAAFFPGVIYLAALFPISVAIAGMLGAIYASVRAKWRPAPAVGFASAAVAAFSYLTPLVLAPAAFATAVVSRSPRGRFRLVATGLGAVAGFGAVLLTMQVTVHNWNAYFDSTRKYAVGVHSPLSTLWRHMEPAWQDLTRTTPVQHEAALQTMLTLALLVVAVVLTVVRVWRATAPGTFTSRLRDAATAQRFDVMLLLVSVGVWLVPYLAGGMASTYRSEALVVVCVPLFRRLPAWVLAPAVIAAVVVAWRMSAYFFNFRLI